MDTDDPFLQVQSDVLSNLDAARPLFQSYLRIRSTASSATSPELREARNELEHVLQELTVDLADLVESVRAVEKDHYRYGLEIEEVQRRRQLVVDVGREVEEMHQELKKAVQQTGAGATAEGLPHPSNFDNDEDDEEGGYGQFEEQRQMEIMAEQDEALEGVFKTVGNLRLQADTMGRELEEQAELIDEVDNVAERVGGKLQTGMKKIGYVIQKNEDTYSSCCIALLIVMLIVLLVIVIAI